MAIPLPPLPEPHPDWSCAASRDLWTKMDMEDYARAAQRFALEQAAKKCEEYGRQSSAWLGQDSEPTDSIAGLACISCATMIREMAKEIE